MKDYTIAVLGCGVMGTAVASAILKAKFDPYPIRIIGCTNSVGTNDLLKSQLKHEIFEYSYGSESNTKAVSEADIIILGCKPYMYQAIYDEIKSGLTGKQLVISLLAGTTISELTIFSSYVAKVMTNTPARFGCGTAAISFSKEAEAEYEDLVMKLIGTVGEAFKIPEKNMDAATALVGSGPAFCLLMMEALIDGGVRMGLPFEVAKLSAAKVMEGTARMVLETNDHPAVLKSKVCTPGGTTIAGLLKMEDAGIRSGIARGVEEAAIVSASFAKKK
ncbi:delta 1-pyrroline-5-carboxylate reductase [Scheffersomyces coipomensis]|uniref:delta 1-pyrroline-5-carboxylate reductase n=1 Tax=Scheffersomyces coipomensis TaxID=1788519 RepID=UPI00315C6926